MFKLPFDFQHKKLSFRFQKNEFDEFGVGKDFRGSPLVGCVVEVSTKLKGFWKRFFVPHILKKGFLLPPCPEKLTPKSRE